MTKSMSAYAFKAMAKTMTARMVTATLGAATNMDNFKACVLGPTAKHHSRTYGGLIQARFGNLGARASTSAKTHVGAVHARDLIALRCPSGDVAVAWCLMCGGCDDQVALVVSQLTPEGNARYRASPSGAAGVVPADALLDLLAYYNDGDFVHIYVPITLR